MKYTYKIFLAHLLAINTLSSLPPLITSMIIKKNRVDIIANKIFTKNYLQEDFFVQYPEDINLEQLPKSVVTIPFILNMATMVWFSEQNYSVEYMDEDLYYSLAKIKEALRLFYPSHTWSGEIIPDKLIKNTITPTNNNEILGVLFTGGLDATYTSVTHQNKKQLLITLTTHPKRMNNNWNTYIKSCKYFAQKFGHEHVTIKTNFRDCIQWPFMDGAQKDIINWRSFVWPGLGYPATAYPLLFAYNITTLLHAGSNSPNCALPYGSHPLIENNIRCAGIQTWHDGDGTRVEKLKYLTGYYANRSDKPTLHVCWSSSTHNCCKCEKCVRTLTPLLAFGCNPKDYGFTKSLNVYIHAMRTQLRVIDNITPGTVYHWQSAQEAVSNALKKGSIKHPNLKKIFEEILAVDFAQKINPHTPNYTEQDYQIYKKLWLEASAENPYELSLKN